MRVYRYLLCCVLLSLTTGCTTYSLQELRHTTPKGTAFQAALAKKYLAFAEEEAVKYDWEDSAWFANKGLMAAYGKETAPEELEAWGLPEARLADLRAAREKLLAALASGVAEHAAEKAADAQYFFDCWVENASEDWQADEIAFCRDGFAGAMTALAGEAKPEAPAAEEKSPAVSIPDSENALAPPPPEPQKEAYLVLFAAGRDTLDVRGEHVVEGVVKELMAGDQNYTVVLNGHTDATGTRRQNFELSRRRAEAVRAALVKRGISEGLIRTFGFGETDPAVPAKPGVPEPRNRRVEIYVGD